MLDRWVLPLIVRMQVSKAEGERGDVPGWVMITLMTVAIATAIWTLTSTKLTSTLTNVLDNMTGEKKP